MSTIDYLRMHADPNGDSHCQTRHIDLQTSDYAPPAPPLGTSPRHAAEVGEGS